MKQQGSDLMELCSETGRKFPTQDVETARAGSDFRMSTDNSVRSHENKDVSEGRPSLVNRLPKVALISDSGQVKQLCVTLGRSLKVRSGVMVNFKDVTTLKRS